MAMRLSAAQPLHHRGYAGFIEQDAPTGIVHGRVLGITDVIHYEATSVKALTQAFRDSVDDYLAMCEQAGESPNKPAVARS